MNIAYTKFGEFVRILRIRWHQVMGDMASVLDTSIPFLSAVENGKKNIPQEWISKIINHYQLTDEEAEELKEAAEESKLQYKITAGNAGITKRKAALQFARSFDNMDDETANKILELLSKKEGE